MNWGTYEENLHFFDEVCSAGTDEEIPFVLVGAAV